MPTDNQTTDYEEAVRRMEKHIQRQADGTFTLDIDDGASIGVDPVVFADLKRSMEQTNHHVRSGDYQVGDTWTWTMPNDG